MPLITVGYYLQDLNLSSLTNRLLQHWKCDVSAVFDCAGSSDVLTRWLLKGYTSREQASSASARVSLVTLSVLSDFK